jgi:hypothetical protein
MNTDIGTDENTDKNTDILIPDTNIIDVDISNKDNNLKTDTNDNDNNNDENKPSDLAVVTDIKTSGSSSSVSSAQSEYFKLLQSRAVIGTVGI